MGKSIQILLSTYNGEKYLREQLNSFLSLDNIDDIKVLIRDDGSKDGTLEILHEYREKHGFEIIEGSNIGLNASMYELIKNRDRNCDYFSFSDQDDVWLADKVSRGVITLSKANQNSPRMYAACSNLTDVNLNIEGNLMIPKRQLTFFNAIVENVCAGHTQIINKPLMNILADKYSPDIVVFDHWVYLLASTVGEVVFDSKCTTLYRQHGNNVIGYKTSFFAKIKQKATAVKNNICQKTTRQLIAFSSCCDDVLTAKQKKEINNFLNKQKNFFTRLTYFFTSKLYRQIKMDTLIVRFLYLFGWYKLKK